jgi:hypothetical protein
METMSELVQELFMSSTMYIDEGLPQLLEAWIEFAGGTSRTIIGESV